MSTFSPHHGTSCQHDGGGAFKHSMGLSHYAGLTHQWSCLILTIVCFINCERLCNRSSQLHLFLHVSSPLHWTHSQNLGLLQCLHSPIYCLWSKISFRGQAFSEVLIVLHWFLLESSRIQAIPGIPGETILAQRPAKLIIPFWWNVEQNLNSAGMVPGFTWTEWHLEQQDWNPWYPNWASAFANAQFGLHQPIICFFLNHHHHHQWCPPMLPPHHCHIFVTVTNGCLPPHPLPTTKTARTTWQCHVTNQTSAGCINAAQWHEGFKVPCHWLWCGNHTMNDDNVIIYISTWR